MNAIDSLSTREDVAAFQKAGWRTAVAEFKFGPLVFAAFRATPPATPEKPKPHGFILSGLLMSLGALIAAPIFLRHPAVYSPLLSLTLGWISLMVRIPPVNRRPPPNHTRHLPVRRLLAAA